MGEVKKKEENEKESDQRMLVRFLLMMSSYDRSSMLPSTIIVKQ